MMRNLTLYCPRDVEKTELSRVLVAAGAKYTHGEALTLERGPGVFLFFEPVTADEVSASAEAGMIPYESPQVCALETRGLEAEREIVKEMMRTQMWVANDWWVMPSDVCLTCMISSPKWDPFSARTLPAEVEDPRVRFFSVTRP
jgi:hypothetical protein